MTSLPLSCSGQLIASTVSWWLMEILIQPPAFLFVLLGRFLFLIFTPTGSSQRLHLTLQCVSYQSKTHGSFLFLFFFNHANYCGANPDCCCHGNCLSGVVVPLKLKWMRKWEEVGDRLQRRHAQSSLCTNIFHVSSCFATCTLGSLPWVQAVWPPRFPQCQKMNLMGVNGDKCSFSTRCQEVPGLRPAHWSFIHCIKWMCWVQGGVSEI